MRKDRDDVLASSLPTDDINHYGFSKKVGRPPESSGKRRRTANPGPAVEDFQTRQLQKTSSISSVASRNKVLPAPAMSANYGTGAAEIKVQSLNDIGARRRVQSNMIAHEGKGNDYGATVTAESQDTPYGMLD